MQLLVDVMAARVLDISGDIAAGRGGLASHQTRVDQQPRAMADRGDRLTFVRELLRQRDRILIDADTIHIAGAAGHHQQVVVGSLHVGQARVRGQRFTFVAVVLHRLTRVQGSGGKRHLGAGGLEIAQRARQLGLLDTPVVDDDQYLAVFDSHANLLDSANNFHEPFSHAERLPYRCSI